MGKYINVPQSILGTLTATNTALVVVGNSGTTTGAAEGKLTDAGLVPDFVTTVTVGDIVIITTGITGYPVRSWATVTAIDSTSVLSISGGTGVGADGKGGLAEVGTVYSIIKAADAYQCVVSGSNFKSVLQPGDWVLNTTTDLNYQVKEVLSDTAILLSSPGSVIVGDSVVLLSTRGEGSVRVCIDNLSLMRGNIANGQLTLHYLKGPSGGTVTQKLTVDPSESITTDAFAKEFIRLAEITWSSKWTNVTTQMKFVGGGTQGIIYGGALTWA
jgi:hypothetical protein|tara:strand:+ start:871 stop:1686 length:816 start_codon:yes stop_codon:yes gene_type:complete